MQSMVTICQPCWDGEHDQCEDGPQRRCLCWTCSEWAGPTEDGMEP